MTKDQHLYLESWHDCFVNYKNGIISLADTMKQMESATDADRYNLDLFKTILHRKDVQDVERDLANAIVKKSTLDKIEKLDKDIVDFAIEHMSVCSLFQHILKQVSYYQIEYNKQIAIMQLNDLNILLCLE